MGDLRMVSSERVSLQFIVPLRQFLQALLAVVNTVTGEHSIKNETNLYSRSNWQWESSMR